MTRALMLVSILQVKFPKLTKRPNLSRMDADVIRLILFLAGIALVVGIYLWDRYKKNDIRIHAVRKLPPEEPAAAARPNLS